MYIVKVTLDGCPVLYELCKCEDRQKVLAVLDALWSAGQMKPLTIERTPAESVPAATGENPWPEEVA